MIALLVAIYLGLSAGTWSAALLPSMSGLPALIHATVAPTGLDPTCKYTPSNCGLNLLPFPALAASESGGKSITIIPLGMGLSPTPNPAKVNALASACLASLSFENNWWAGLFGFHILYEPGENTVRPSLRFNDIPDRFSSTNSCTHPHLETIIAISFARFCASGSPGTTWINSFVPAQRSRPANQVLALGSSLSPISPACLGSSFVNAIFSGGGALLQRLNLCGYLFELGSPVKIRRLGFGLGMTELKIGSDPELVGGKPETYGRNSQDYGKSPDNAFVVSLKETVDTLENERRSHVEGGAVFFIIVIGGLLTVLLLYQAQR
jgi:hypothetical protein